MINWNILLFTVVLIPSMAYSKVQVLDKVVAIVNNSIVLDSDVNRIMQSVQSQAKQFGQSLPDEKEVRFHIINKLITDNIFLQKAEQVGLRVSDSQLDQVIINIAKQNKMSIDQLYKNVADQGLDYFHYREQIRHDMTVLEFRNRELRHRIRILPQEVDSLADQIHLQRRSSVEFNLSSALFPLSGNPTNKQLYDQKNIANEFARKVKDGFDFRRVKIPHVLDEEVIPTREMGWRGVQELPFSFIPELLNAHIDSVIGPIQSRIGWHVLKVNDIRGDIKKNLVTELHAMHIMLKNSPDMSSQQAKQKIFRASEDIKSGKSLHQVSQELYRDVRAVYKGGDLGWVSIGMFDPQFHATLRKMKKGQISNPVHSMFGWHIMYIIGTRTVDQTNDMYKNEAYHLLLNRKFSVALEQWIADERAAAYIQVLP
ncbi:Chaperone SurA [Candidatus Erwinia haradaeae]|uniref:Chaperone SurA n=1 Tax=Candidatus Erwinia haradaeae TaxID=1922217 RepID=A0A451DDI3_9GAMM|nr:peptidylprolyl isomerase SurA [Candidatus Erwinia haradaeae]VFP84541.1 Chaperone SurA [Candidatus Erwinia haradaeae]